VAVVPLLQFKPVSQQPVHWGHGPDPDDVDVAVEVELVVEELDEDWELAGEDDVDRELDVVELPLGRDAVPDADVIDVVEAPADDAVLPFPVPADPLLP
jgi:hypothetical protein